MYFGRDVSQRKPKWPRWGLVLAIVSVLLSVAFAGIMVYIASQQPLSPLETILFQIIVLIIGLGGGLFGSYKFGKTAASESARAVIRPHARSALRSVIVLNNDLIAMHEPIDQLARSTSDQSVAMLHHLVASCSRVAAASINNWRDVIPEDFQDFEGTVVQPITADSEGTD